MTEHCMHAEERSEDAHHEVANAPEEANRSAKLRRRAFLNASIPKLLEGYDNRELPQITPTCRYMTMDASLSGEQMAARKRPRMNSSGTIKIVAANCRIDPVPITPQARM